MDRKAYYRTDVLFEIVKQLVGRETVLLKDVPPIRGIKAHKVSYLLDNFDRFEFFVKNYNIYYSLSRLMNMPQFSHNMELRKQQYLDFNRIFDNYVVGYDLGMDFDSSSATIVKQYGKELISECYEETVLIKSYFDKYKVPYTLKNSSATSFHLCIDSKYLPEYRNSGELREKVVKHKFANEFNNRLKSIFALKTLDANLFDNRRVWKVAYSLDVKDNVVSLPLNDNMFRMYDKEMVEPEFVFRSQIIKNRGLLERDGNQENFLNFCRKVLDMEI